MPDNAQEAPPLPPESEPTPDEIAAHAQDDEDEEDIGLGMPTPGDLPHIVRDTLGRGSAGRRDPAERVPAHLPDVNAGGSHARALSTPVRPSQPQPSAAQGKASWVTADCGMASPGSVA